MIRTSLLCVMNMKRKALVESCGVILDRHPFFVKNKDLLGSLDRSVQSQERATFEILVGKAEPLLASRSLNVLKEPCNPLIYKRKRIKNIALVSSLKFFVLFH